MVHLLCHEVISISSCRYFFCGFHNNKSNKETAVHKNNIDGTMRAGASAHYIAGHDSTGSHLSDTKHREHTMYIDFRIAWCVCTCFACMHACIPCISRGERMDHTAVMTMRDRGRTKERAEDSERTYKHDVV